MVVVAIIIILAGITIAVGVQVRQGAKRKNTVTELQALTGYMDQYLGQGNPEPVVPGSPSAPPTLPWPYTSADPAFAKTKDSAGVTPGSDPFNWVRMLRATPVGTKLSDLTLGDDRNGYTAPPPSPNITVLDSWGTAIRYIPSNSVTKAKGYFQSAGPDGRFANENPPPSPALPPDDIFSNVAQ
jgi:type II secretory pathway pseudopilin PulG